MKKSFTLCLFMLFVASYAFSGDITWTGAGTAGDWEDPANWNLNRVPDGDDVIIDGAYSIIIDESNPTIEKLTLSNGASLTIALGYTLTVYDNGSDGVRIEKTGGTLTINGTLNSYDHGNYGVRLDSANTEVIINGTLNTYDNKDGLNVDGPGAVVTVNGTLNAYDNSSDGIDIDDGNTLNIPSSGKIYLNNNDGDGFKMKESFVNNGLISSTNSGDIGFNLAGSSDETFINNGTLTISGAILGFDGKDTDWYTTNNNIMIISACDTLIDDGTNIYNYGTFQGDGLVENGNYYDIQFLPGSTLVPGTSAGKFTFTEILDLSGVNLDIEINALNSYDQIVVDTGIQSNADVTITNAVLNLSGSYIPAPGDEFMFLEKKSPGPITGTFSGYPNNSTYIFNGVELTITYNGGDGNDITFTNLAPLPIELIDFNAQAMEKDVKLAWTTASEENNDFFTIEKSLDGRIFEEVAKISGRGNSTEISKYEYMDLNPIRGINYYRLKQTDFDGQFSYSNIETVEFIDDENIKIYPTLVTENITIEINKKLNSGHSIIIRDLTGRASKSFAISRDEIKKEVNLTDLAPGNYFITIYNDKTRNTLKFIKQ